MLKDVMYIAVSWIVGALTGALIYMLAERTGYSRGAADAQPIVAEVQVDETDN